MDLDHDFLWRIHAAVPPKGAIGIFNRSQYEDVLIARVHELVPPAVWKERYTQINNFERMLTENNVCILKFFLHMSRKEQHRRFDERQTDPRKNWKASAAGLQGTRILDSISGRIRGCRRQACGTKEAPGMSSLSDHKWFRNSCGRGR